MLTMSCHPDYALFVFKNKASATNFIEHWGPTYKIPQPWVRASFMGSHIERHITATMEDMFWPGDDVAWDAQPTSLTSVDADVWAQLQESSARVEG